VSASEITKAKIRCALFGIPTFCRESQARSHEIVRAQKVAQKFAQASHNACIQPETRRTATIKQATAEVIFPWSDAKVLNAQAKARTINWRCSEQKRIKTAQLFTESIPNDKISCTWSSTSYVDFKSTTG
jgi:hypothetical protein